MEVFLFPSRAEFGMKSYEGEVDFVRDRERSKNL